jgi:hypothetical protein
MFGGGFISIMMVNLCGGENGSNISEWTIYAAKIPYR